MLIMTVSGISWHFSLVGPRSRSQLHMAGAFITLSDGLVCYLVRHHVTFTSLTLEAPIMTAADDIYKYFFIVFQRK